MPSATVGILRVLLTANSAEFEAAMKRAQGTAQSLSKDFGSIGRQATQLGSTLTRTLTLPLVAALGGAAKAAIDFESGFANVGKTVDGVSDKAGNLTTAGKALALVFRDMAKTIPATTEELTAIAALGGQMGVPIQQLEKFTKHVAALGVAVDGISTEEAAAGLAQIGNITGQGTANIDKMASALVHLGNSSSATEADILEFTKRLAGAGHAVGMTVPEIMALGTAMANVGINAEAGGTAMSTVISKMSKAVSEGSAQLTEFAHVANMSAEQFASVWRRSPIEALDAFVKGLSAMKARGVDLNLTMGELGTEGIRVADTLKRLAGAGDGIARSLTIANEGFATGNKHLEEAEKKYATTANQLKLLWNQIKDVGITLGDALLPALKTVTGLIRDYVLPIVDTLAKAFTAMPGGVQLAALGLVGLAAAAGPVIWAIGKLIESTGIIIGAFSKKGLAARLLTTDLVGLTTAVRGLGSAMLSLPFAALLASVGAVGVAIAKIRQQYADLASDAAKAARQTTATGGQMGREAIVAQLVTKERELNEAIRDGNKVRAARLQAEVDAIKNDQTRLAMLDVIDKAIAQGADKNIKYGEAIEFNAKKQKEHAESLKKTAEEQSKVNTSTDAAVIKQNALKQAQEDIAAANKKYTQELSGVRDALALQIRNMEVTGKTAADLAKQYHISEETVSRFKRELDNTIKVQRQAEKATDELTKRLEKQADALEKLGIVTENQVLKQLGELNELVTLAVAAGVPFDKVLAAITPRLDELRRKAQASGVSLEVFGDSLGKATKLAGEMLTTIIDSVPGAVAGLKELPGTLIPFNGALAIAEIQAQNTADSFRFFGITTRAQLVQTAKDAVAHFRTIKESGQASPQAIQDAFKKMNDALRAAGMKTEETWTDVFKSIRDNWKALTQDLLGSLSGGLSGLKSFATDFAKDFLGGLLSFIPAIGPWVARLAGPIVDGLKKLFSNIFGIGTAGRDTMRAFFEEMGGEDELRRRLVAGLGDRGHQLMNQLFRIGRNNREQAEQTIASVRKALEEIEARQAKFNDTLGGTLQQIRELGGVLPDSLMEYLRGLERAGTLTEDNIALLNELTGTGTVTWQQIEEAANRYGIAQGNLGQSFHALKLHDAWQQLIDDIDLFERGNVDVNALLVDMADDVSELVQRSIQFGTEIPENMRPWIQKLIDAGLLLDESGEKIEDIGALTFGESLQTSLQRLIESIQSLIDHFNQVPSAVAAIPREIETTVTVRTRKEQIEAGDVVESFAAKGGLVTRLGVKAPQYAAIGGFAGRFWRPRGTDTQPAMLTPGEIILNEGQQGNIARALQYASAAFHAPARMMDAVSGSSGQPMQAVAIMEVDKRELGRAVADVLPGELKRLGVRVRAT